LGKLHTEINDELAKMILAQHVFQEWQNIVEQGDL